MLVLLMNTVLICNFPPYVTQTELAVSFGYSQDVAAPSRSLMEHYSQVVRKPLDCGVPVALGSDCGLCDLSPHGDNATEMEMVMRYVGVSAMQAIELMTSCGAHALGLGEIIGSIETGKCADLIAVFENSRQGIEMIRSPNAPAFIMRSGHILSQEDNWSSTTGCRIFQETGAHQSMN